MKTSQPRPVGRLCAAGAMLLLLALTSTPASAVRAASGTLPPSTPVPLASPKVPLSPAKNAPAAPSPPASPPAPAPSGEGFVPLSPGAQSGKLRVKVIDGRTRKPLEGAEVVVLETEKRYRTGADGLTPWIQAPVLRSARFRFLVNELHGQLTLISYKNGYRDSIHMGVRMNEGQVTKTTIWQYKIVPGNDVRVEPVFFQEPYHRLWLIQLADRFRRPSQLGEGYERP